jgi:hypothetical protein
MEFSPLSVTASLRTLSSDIFDLCSYIKVWDQISHPYKTIGKIIVLYILNCTHKQVNKQLNKQFNKEVNK